jgi:hypothetical protein
MNAGVNMNVQQMINELQKVQDKTLPVCIEDWSERYLPPAVSSAPKLCNAEYLHCGKAKLNGMYICISAIET